MEAIAKPIKMLQWKKWVQRSTRVKLTCCLSIKPIVRLMSSLLFTVFSCLFTKPWISRKIMRMQSLAELMKSIHWSVQLYMFNYACSVIHVQLYMFRLMYNVRWLINVSLVGLANVQGSVWSPILGKFIKALAITMETVYICTYNANAKDIA